MFTTSDIGWVVGHSYIVYAPLINGSTTIMYEGAADPARSRHLVADRRRAQGAHDVQLADRDTRAEKAGSGVHEEARRLVAALSVPRRRAARRADRALGGGLAGRAIVDNYWQTESGWPILSAQLGVEETPRKFGSPSFPVCGYDVKLLHEVTGAEVGTDEKGVLAIVPPLPPGCMTTVWGDDQRFVQTYFATFPGRSVYSTFDWAMRDADGYYFVLGRTDDVINVAGHRLGTREIEEAVQAHPGHRRSRGGRRRRSDQGPDAGGVRGGQGSGVGCHRRTAQRGCERK